MAEYFIIYFVAMNLFTFFVYGDDKARARRGAYRISEAMLIALAVLGGSVGAYLGIYFFHHKTKHKKFTIGVPVIIFMQITIGIWYYKTFIG